MNECFEMAKKKKIYFCLIGFVHGHNPDSILLSYNSCVKTRKENIAGKTNKWLILIIGRA